MARPEGASPVWGAWADMPEPVNEQDVKKRYTCSVLIIGAGIAGMTAAARAAQNGEDVLVIERGKKWSGRGGNIGVPDSSYLRSRGYELDKAEFVREWVKRCANRCDERIVWLFVNNSREAMDWLFEIMTENNLTEPAIQGAIYKGETYRENPGSHRFLNGPTGMKGPEAGGGIEANVQLEKLALEHGAHFMFGMRGEQLIKENGRVTGAYASGADGLIEIRASKGVILATGGIGGNREMCADLCPAANRCAKNVYTPVGQNTGDGHRMGLWAGGIFEDAPFPAIMHPQAFAMRNYCFLFVNHKGERFMNEDSYIQGKCLNLLRQRDGWAWSIIDSAWKEKVPETLEYGGGIFWDHDRELFELWTPDDDIRALKMAENAGYLLRADTPEELAEKMGVPKEAFAATFARYNSLAESGRDEDFGKRPELLIPLDTPPYMALKFGPALLAVVGGLRTDTRLRVVDSALEPIEGLYAIGNAGGGRYGTDYPMLIPGSSHGSAVVFGYLAADFISGKT